MKGFTPVFPEAAAREGLSLDRRAVESAERLVTATAMNRLEQNGTPITDEAALLHERRALAETLAKYY